MSRYKIALLVTLSAVICGFFAFGVNDAKAFQPTNYNIPIEDPNATQSVIDQFIRWLNANESIAAETAANDIASVNQLALFDPPYPSDLFSDTGTAYTAAEADAGMADMAGSLALTPALTSVGIIGAGAIAGYVGWKYVGPYLGNAIYNLVHSDSSLSSTNVYTWSALTGSGAISISGFPTLGGTTGAWAGPLWVLKAASNSSVAYCVRGTSGGAVTTAQAATCDGTGGTGSTGDSVEMSSWLGLIPGNNLGNVPFYVPSKNAWIIPDISTTNACASTAIGACYEVVRYPQAQSQNTTITPTDISGFNASPRNTATPITTAADPTSLFRSALQALELCARSGNRGCQAALAFLSTNVQPGWTPNDAGSTASTAPWTVRQLPLPDEGEDPSAYVNRVRQLGWIGQVSITEDETWDMALAPGITGSYADASVGSIEAISKTGTTPTIFRMYAPFTLSYSPPTSMPQLLTPTDPITIYTKPTDSQYAPTTTLAPGVPPTATIDYSPITSLHVNCTALPFGIFCYIETVIGWFNVTPQAPGFHAVYTAHGTDPYNNISDITPVSGTNDISSGKFTLSSFDSYMSTIRTVESFALWIGAIWLIASRFLKLGGNGDELLGASDDGSVI